MNLGDYKGTHDDARCWEKIVNDVQHRWVLTTEESPYRLVKFVGAVLVWVKCVKAVVEACAIAAA